MSYNPPNPIPTVNNFNYSYFTHLEDVLTIADADKRYLKLSGGSVGFLNVLTNLNVFGEYYKNSLLVDLDSITGVTNGIAQSDKALILDSNKDINNINILSAQNIDIDNTNTTPFSLTGNSDLYGLHLHSNFSGTGQNYGSAISFNHSNANQIPLSAIVLDKVATATGDLVFYTRNGSATLQESMRLKSNGNLGIGVSTPLYQLDLGGSGTGINTGSLKFNDITFNQNLYLNITAGNVEANKALVPNSDLDLGTFRNIDLSGILTTNTINAQTYRLNNVDANISTLTNITLGIAQNQKALTLNQFGNLQFSTGNGNTNNKNGTNALQWYGNTANKEKILMYRPNDDSGLAIVSNPSTIQKCSPLLWLYSGFDTAGVVGTSSAEYREVLRSEHKLIGFSDNYRSGWFHGYLLASQPWGSTQGTQFYTSTGMLNISCNTSATNSFASSNNILMYNNRIILNGNTFYGNEFLKSNGGALFEGSSNWMNGNYNIGLECHSQDNSVRFQICNRNSVDSFVGTVSNHNLNIMTNNSARITISNTSTSINNNTTITGSLTVSGSSNFTLGIGGTNIREYVISSNIWNNLGIGPTQYTLSANFSQPIRANSVYSSSDRRLKNSIKELYIDINKYQELKPVSFKWNESVNKKNVMGLIAQDTLKIASELIYISENDKMEIEDEETDLKGYQYNIDYQQLAVMNTSVIKQLIEKIKKLENRINYLENNN